MDLAPGTQIMTLSLMKKYFKKKRRARSNLKHYQSDKSIKNYVGKCKSSRQKKRKGLYRKNKNILAETTLHLPTLCQFYTAQVRSITPHK